MESKNTTIDINVKCFSFSIYQKDLINVLLLLPNLSYDKNSAFYNWQQKEEFSFFSNNILTFVISINECKKILNLIKSNYNLRTELSNLDKDVMISINRFETHFTRVLNKYSNLYNFYKL